MECNVLPKSWMKISSVKSFKSSNDITSLPLKNGKIHLNNSHSSFDLKWQDRHRPYPSTQIQPIRAHWKDFSRIIHRLTAVTPADTREDKPFFPASPSRGLGYHQRGRFPGFPDREAPVSPGWWPSCKTKTQPPLLSVRNNQHGLYFY